MYSRRAADPGGDGRLAPRPQAEPVDDPELIGPVLKDLARRARRNADMKGNDLD